MSEPLSNLRRPAMNGGVPVCSLEHCPLYDGKRCEAMGFRPDRLCEPEVEEMAAELRERRAANLTSEEREALRDFRDHFGGKHYPDVINRALAALDRLLGKETP